jgi:hypothetical protein
MDVKAKLNTLKEKLTPSNQVKRLAKTIGTTLAVYAVTYGGVVIIKAGIDTLADRIKNSGKSSDCETEKSSNEE